MFFLVRGTIIVNTVAANQLLGFNCWDSTARWAYKLNEYKKSGGGSSGTDYRIL